MAHDYWFLVWATKFHPQASQSTKQGQVPPCLFVFACFPKFAQETLAATHGPESFADLFRSAVTVWAWYPGCNTHRFRTRRFVYGHMGTCRAPGVRADRVLLSLTQTTGMCAVSAGMGSIRARMGHLLVLGPLRYTIYKCAQKKADFTHIYWGCLPLNTPKAPRRRI